jgi:uncharacterized repeat protein (TIGR03803 family)
MLGPTASGPWNLTVLHRFGGQGDGVDPIYELVADKAGDLYGATYGGGIGYGTVFELSQTAPGVWTETVIHTFGLGTDGITPSSGLILDAAGNLYGEDGCGIYELLSQPDGSWSESILYTFGGHRHDGEAPRGGLTFDATGDLYGTTEAGGNIGGGAVFELSPSINGGWTEQVLHSFDYPTYADPRSGVTIDSSGNLYGTTLYGGNASYGTVFELSPGSGGTWTFKSLQSFSRNGAEGFNPWSRLAIDAAGNLYGTTFLGGSADLGVLFELSPQADGTWSETVLHNFIGGYDGAEPVSGPVLNSTGTLFGTTSSGGLQNGGIAYQWTP